MNLKTNNVALKAADPWAEILISTGVPVDKELLALGVRRYLALAEIVLLVKAVADVPLTCKVASESVASLAVIVMT